MKYSKTLTLRFKHLQRRVLFISDDDEHEENFRKYRLELGELAEDLEDPELFFESAMQLSCKYNFSIAKE